MFWEKAFVVVCACVDWPLIQRYTQVLGYMVFGGALRVACTYHGWLLP